MDELEDRVRRGLQHPSMSADATEILADVHRGVRNRQQRRLAVGAAGVLAVLTASGVLTSTDTGPDRSTDMATGPTATPSRTSATAPPATPDAGSAFGTTGFDATPTRSLFAVQADLCDGAPCVQLRSGWDGGLAYDYAVRSFAYDNPAEAKAFDVPPVESVRVSDDGRDLWVYGRQLWTSHDGGDHWTRQHLGANPGEFSQVERVGDQVFALQSSPLRIWRSPASTDDWSSVALPGGYTYADQLTPLGNTVVVSAMKDDRRMVLSLNAAGGSWREAEAPCQGEVGAVRGTGTVLMAPCPGDGSFSDAPLVVWRSWDGVAWKPFVGVNHSSYVDDVIAIDDDSLFVVTGEGGILVSEKEQLQVRLPLDESDTSLQGEFVDADHGLLLVSSPQRLLVTDDGGRTWSLVR